jgi:ribosomal-protein-alanine N-acetyltransferase
MRLNAVLDHWEQHGFGLCAVIDKAGGAFIGFCGLQYLDGTSEIEVGYRLAKRFWGQGLATEAASASLKYGFDELGLDRIVAVVHPKMSLHNGDSEDWAPVRERRAVLWQRA